MLEWADLWKNFPGLAFGLTMLYLFLKERIARDLERTLWMGRYDTLLAMLLKLVPDAIRSDSENIAALKGVSDGLVALKAGQERLERKVNA